MSEIASLNVKITLDDSELSKIDKVISDLEEKKDKFDITATLAVNKGPYDKALKDVIDETPTKEAELAIDVPVSLDTKSAMDKITAAFQPGGDLANALAELGNPPVQAGIDSNGNVFASIIGDAQKATEEVQKTKAEIDSADSKMGEVEGKATQTKSILQDLLSAEVIKQVVTGILDFGRASVNAAASTGSELAAAYTTAKTGFDEMVAGWQLSLGEKILPMITAVYDALTPDTTFGGEVSAAKEQRDIAIAKARSDEAIAAGYASNLFAMGEFNQLNAGAQATWRANAEALIALYPSLSESIDLASGSIQGNQKEIESLIATQTKERIAAAEAEKDAKENAALAEEAKKRLALETEISKERARIEKESGSTIEEATKKYEAYQAALKKAEELNAVDLIGESYTYEQIEANTENTNAYKEYLESVGGDDAGFENYLQMQSDLDAMNASFQQHAASIDGSTASIDALDGSFGSLSASAKVLAGDFSSVTTEANTLQTAGDTLGGSTWEPTVDLTDNASGGIKSIDTELNKLDGKTVSVKVNISTSGSVPNVTGFATGLDRVPFDNFPARLHRNEAVLTAAEADNWRKGVRGAADQPQQPINLTVNVTGVAKNPYEIADEVRNALELMRWQS